MQTHSFNIFQRMLLSVCVCFFIPFSVIASSLDNEISTRENAPFQKDSVNVKSHTPERESIFPQKSLSLSESHFTWGGEFGASIDLSGYDTSTFDVDIVFGYKNSYLRLLGIGAGVHRAFGTGDNFVPVYAVLRTSFSKKQRPVFMSLKVGYSFNTMGDAPTFGDTNASLGCGFNLAISRKFKSHIILAYEFRHFNKRHKDVLNMHADNISLATLSFGVNF